MRVNRGFRVQYSSALGPYEGGTDFSSHTTLSYMKAKAFDTTLTNALAMKNIGGAYGGADINPYAMSETEIQRFCHSYMTVIRVLPSDWMILFIGIEQVHRTGL